MIENPLKSKLAKGEPILGVWSIIPSSMIVEISGLAGLNFQILDMEHGVWDLQSLETCIRACEAVDCSPLVRVPGIAPFTVQQVMDIGAHGVIFPQVSNEDTARRAVQATKYAPDGTRGYNPFTRVAHYSNPPTNEGGKLSNDFGFTSVIIESESAWQSLDAILKVPYLDMIYLGVYDMSVALGCRGDTAHPKVVEFVESSVARVRNAGLAVGVMVRSRVEMNRMLELGANVLVFGVDTWIIHNAVSNAVDMLRSAREGSRRDG